MISLLVVLSTLVHAALYHPVHETVCEVEWNEKTQRLEVALRLDALDEQWLKKAFQESRHADAESGSWQERLVRTQLLFDPRPVPKGDSRGDEVQSGLPIRWIGSKEERGHVWWFFEVVCNSGNPPKKIHWKILFDRDTNYRHRVVVLGVPRTDDGKRPTIVLTHDNPIASLSVR